MTDNETARRISMQIVFSEQAETILRDALQRLDLFLAGDLEHSVRGLAHHVRACLVGLEVILALIQTLQVGDDSELTRQLRHQVKQDLRDMGVC